MLPSAATYMTLEVGGYQGMEKGQTSRYTEHWNWEWRCTTSSLGNSAGFIHLN